MAVINVTAEASDSTRTYIKTGGHSIVIDEPPLFGGEDTAPSPVAMFLASLAGCINAIGQWVSKEMDFKIERLYVNIDGEVDGTAFFTGSKEKRALWLKNVVERCPVSDNIMNMTPVNFNVK